MGKPVILLTRKLPQEVEERAAGAFALRTNPMDHPIPAAFLPERALGVDGLLVTPTDSLDRTVIAALPDSVKIIATFSVGFEHIDVAEATRRGIVVTHTPGVLTEATADLTLLLILAAARRASEGERLLRSGTWNGWAPTQLLGVHLAGKRLGLFGMGRIAQAVVPRARAFGLTPHYHSRRRLPAEVEARLGVTWHETPDSLLAVSDILSLHCPSTPETRRFLNEQRLARLPAGAIVINTARGNVIDDDALIAALRSKRLAAAGLDVYDNEPRLHPGYRAIANAVLLPHLGSATEETRIAMGTLALDNLEAFFSGRPLPSPVPYSKA